MRALSLLSSVRILLIGVPALCLAACGGGGSGGGGGGVGGSATALVTTLADSGPGSLREVMGNASGSWSDTIAFHPDLEGGTIALDSPIVLTTNILNLDGNVNGHRMILDGQGVTRIFEIPEGLNLRMRDLELRNGLGVYGGAIHAEGGLTVEHCLFHNNDASSGGGAIAARSVLQIDRCAFTVNTARWGGALFLTNCDRARAHRSSFLLNTARQGGGIHLISCDMAIVASTMHMNSAINVATGRGSAINIGTNPMWGPSDVRVIGCTITDNTDAAASTAAVWADSATDLITLEIRGSLIADNDGASQPDLRFGAGVALQGGGNLIGIGIGVFGFQNGVDDNLVGTVGIPQTPYISGLQTLPDGRAYRVPNDGFASHDAIPSTWMLLDPTDALVPFLMPVPQVQTLSTDELGNARVVGPAADYGAVERQ